MKFWKRHYVFLKVFELPPDLAQSYVKLQITSLQKNVNCYVLLWNLEQFIDVP